MANKNPLIDFKIIAIKPLKNCREDLLKVLGDDHPYYFYNDYKLDDNDNFTYTQSYPSCLYDYGNLKINVCAVAGKNGSGKSTVSDLILMAINNIACHFGMKEDLKPVQGLRVALYVKFETLHKIVVENEIISVFDYDESGRLLPENSIVEGKFNRSSMFYSICINYSHYAYNSADYISTGQEDWLSALFHKNDAYQTPLVINPWRDEGNIIINRENELVKSRLVANLLRSSGDKSYDFRNVTENHRAKRLILTANSDQFYRKELYKISKTDKKGITTTEIVDFDYLLNNKKIDTHDVLQKINKVFEFGYNEKKNDQIQELDLFAMHYLVRKLITVSIKYEEYNGYYIVENHNFSKDLSKFINLLIKDSSHIAFKFKQTLNYLRHKHIPLEEKDQTLDNISSLIQQVIAKKQTHKDKLIELIPPPIFTIDIILETIKDKKEEIAFRLLSSGEKQMVYSMNSMLYHLVNLDSVRVTTKKKVKYKCVQIILEEIELYFHPELQRKYVNFLRRSIINLRLNSIKNVSICFVTHSPFILSDIPNSNIMFLALEGGSAIRVNKQQKTFAANIHNLLATGFFMNEGLCGEFAIDQINNTVVYLNNAIRLNEVRRSLELDKKNYELLKEKEVLEAELSREKKEDHALLIRNVAEPVLASKLIEMYDEAFYNPEKENIREQIASLREQLLNI
ncbi:hypothetical protein [Pedobacter faecalis]|uniref:hypothetical protein n=1 Tax=Pedobacter faecalis TaxID=3041495 RepID=UPI00254B71F0|nr:hypothetical protein [Pedobacter sp. ELA7]